ncbi:MAG: hypothetical protein QOD74_1662 [Variibacter sp.]|jgi:hypothetical protein|nr:hypothetical protein [Variibacter sp.]
MDEIERQIAAIIRRAIESGNIISVTRETRRLVADSRNSDTSLSPAEVAEALADCATAARVPVEVG